MHSDPGPPAKRPTPSRHSDLIYDVGAANGDDSAYYLHRGFRVVAVEANPLSVAQLRERFRSEIDEGRYLIVARGIAESSGTAEFWMCDDCPEWSSFDRGFTSWNGMRHHSVIVDTCRFSDVVEQFGVPFYCKIDIEGSDDLCLDDLSPATAPQFLSIEAGDDAAAQIRRLSALGYHKFKIISQLSLRQPNGLFASLKARLPLRARSMIEAASRHLRRYSSHGDWDFPFPSSGPFGDEAQGAWLSADQAIELNRLFQKGSTSADWQDIHASLAQAAPDRA